MAMLAQIASSNNRRRTLASATAKTASATATFRRACVSRHTSTTASLPDDVSESESSERTRLDEDRG